MKFEEYEHIIDANHKRTLDKFFYGGHLLDSVEWCITEKVHGVHFDIAYNGSGEVEFWSRNRKVPRKNNFRNYHRIREHLEDCIINAYEIIESDYGIMDFDLIICGELFGGNYPHKDVESIGIKGIQKGVYYYNDVGFYAFDIKINGEFINYYDVIVILNESTLLTAEILKSGTFRECMEYPNKFQTNLPMWMSLPEIEDNICEGIVLKPITPTRCFDGTRVIFKSKNERFAEKKSTPKIPKEPIVLNDKVQGIYDRISLYITPQRLDNVLSKMDLELLDKKKGFGKIMGVFKKDVIESFNEYNIPNMNFLEKKDRILVVKLIGKLCVPLVKKEWMQIIE